MKKLETNLSAGIKPERYTNELLNKQGDFGINVPTAEQVEVVRIFGSISGRDSVDKYEEAGVTPVNIDEQIIHYT